MDDKFGLEYARYRNAENEQRLEQARKGIAVQLLGGQQAESARKEALYCSKLTEQCQGPRTPSPRRSRI